MILPDAVEDAFIFSLYFHDLYRRAYMPRIASTATTTAALASSSSDGCAGAPVSRRRRGFAGFLTPGSSLRCRKPYEEHAGKSARQMYAKRARCHHFSPPLKFLPG